MDNLAEVMIVLLVLQQLLTRNMYRTSLCIISYLHFNRSALIEGRRRAGVQGGGMNGLGPTPAHGPWKHSEDSLRQ
jgi:hypothetical protein